MPENLAARRASRSENRNGSRRRSRGVRRVGVLALVAGAVALSVAVVCSMLPAPHDAHVAAEIAYVQGHWSERNVDEYGSLGSNDCANFASQALIARGWTQDADWWHHSDGSSHDYSLAWIGSTSMSRWLAQHPEWAEPLDDDERDQVAVGDIVQFDWNDSGNRDHTGIVTKVEHRGEQVRILYDSHSHDRHDFSVDSALKIGGGTAYYWHLLR